MGKIIEFELDYTLPETGYYCTCCKNTEIDHSGKYVPAADHEALQSNLEKTEKTLAARERAMQGHAVCGIHGLIKQDDPDGTTCRVCDLQAKLSEAREEIARLIAYYDAAMKGWRTDNSDEVIEHAQAVINAAKGRE